ncbi:MAG: class I SAM-dependent methyltransferase [Candidatus Peregrinibacteria bacterium]
MDSRRTSHLAYEDLGARFDSFMSPYDVSRRQKLVEYFLTRIPAPEQCLETGCGTGKISDILRDRVTQLIVSDISATLARTAAERIGCDWRQENVCHLSFPDETFDVVVSSECIEHTENPLKALAEMCRVLKPGGTLIVTTPNKLWYPILLLSQGLHIRKFTGTIENWLWPRQIVAHLRKNNMQICVIRGCHLYPWQIPFLRVFLPLFDRWSAVLWPMMITFGVCARKQ